jgi:hypothetical protein
VTQSIYIFSPSSAVRNKAAVRRGVARLKKLGYEVELDPSVFATHMRFAGDDEVRLASIERAAASGADIAVISRGGYGLTRLLPALPYRAIATRRRAWRAIRRRHCSSTASARVSTAARVFPHRKPSSRRRGGHGVGSCRADSCPKPWPRKSRRWRPGASTCHRALNAHRG